MTGGEAVGIMEPGTGIKFSRSASSEVPTKSKGEKSDRLPNLSENVRHSIKKHDETRLASAGLWEVRLQEAEAQNF